MRDHVVQGLPAIARLPVDRLDRVLQHDHGVAEPERIGDGIAHAVFGSNAAHENPLDLQGLQRLLQAGAGKAGIRLGIARGRFGDDVRIGG